VRTRGERWQQPMKTLYFDVNRTIVLNYVCKPALAGGIFEDGIRGAGFHRLVCVSNVQHTIQFLEEIGQAPDSLGIMFDMCWGAFRDRDWFGQVTTIVAEPEHRARYIDFTGDWWYLDDLARDYFERERFSQLYEANNGGRILAPLAESDGTEILRWLRASVSAACSNA